MATTYRQSWSDRCQGISALSGEQCITLLSRYNPGGSFGSQLCWLHQSQASVKATDIEGLAKRLAKR